MRNCVVKDLLLENFFSAAHQERLQTGFAHVRNLVGGMLEISPTEDIIAIKKRLLSPAARTLRQRSQWKT